jgi:excisionase family DNA binding protein
VNETYLAPEPFERIAQGIERLIEVLVPQVETPKNLVVEMLTPAQAAKKMGLNVQTVREWCRAGKLGVRTGGRWLISPDEVKQYLRGQLLIKGKVAG